MKKIYSSLYLLLSINLCFSQITILKDINSGTTSGIATNFFATANNMMFFIADDGNGDQLWKTDGTSASTIKLTSNMGNSTIGQWSVINNKVVFSLLDGASVYGRELWVTDGTVSGTTILKDINSGTTSGIATNFFATANNMMFFIADDGNGDQLWKTDGTSAGTIKLTSSMGNSTIGQWSVINNKVVFSLFDGASVYGRELWVTDGTVSGTTILKDINSGTTSGIATNFFATANNMMFFIADDGNGDQLWKTDGTSAGTIKLTSNMGNSTIGQWSVINNKVVFSLFDGASVYGRELWVTDGTVSGTTILKDINSGTTSGIATNFFATANNMMFFIADDGNGDQLWKTDGTSAGTIKLTSNMGNSTIGQWSVINNKVVFSLLDGASVYGRELWVTDGTVSGTTILRDINSGTTSGIATNFFATANNMMFFIADDGNGDQLWKTDGTSAGTIKLTSNMGNSTIGQWSVINNKVVFSLFDGASVYGRELWVTDGTVSGTTILKDINSGTTSGIATNFFATANNMMFFIADDGNGDQLWKTDGTSASTIKLTSNMGNSTIGQWSVINNKVVFSLFDGASVYGRELWVTGGIVTGIIDNDSFERPMIYPNPSKGQFSINTLNINESVDVSITDMSGKRIDFTKQKNDNLILVNFNEPRGIYIVSVTYGEKLVTYKLIKY